MHGSRSPVTILPLLLTGSLSPHFLLLLANLERLGPIIFDPLVEPRVVESLLGRYPLGRIIYEDPLEQIEKLQIEFVVRRNSVLRYLVRRSRE